MHSTFDEVVQCGIFTIHHWYASKTILVDIDLEEDWLRSEAITREIVSMLKHQREIHPNEKLQWAWLPEQLSPRRKRLIVTTANTLKFA